MKKRRYHIGRGYYITVTSDTFDNALFINLDDGVEDLGRIKLGLDTLSKEEDNG